MSNTPKSSLRKNTRITQTPLQSLGYLTANSMAVYQKLVKHDVQNGICRDISARKWTTYVVRREKKKDPAHVALHIARMQEAALPSYGNASTDIINFRTASYTDILTTTAFLAPKTKITKKHLNQGTLQLA
jgi:hypothetical protein